MTNKETDKSIYNMRHGIGIANKINYLVYVKSVDYISDRTANRMSFFQNLRIEFYNKYGSQ